MKHKHRSKSGGAGGGVTSPQEDNDRSQYHRSNDKNMTILDLDTCFTNITSTDNLTFSFNSSDVTVIENLELPLSIPAACGGVLSYKFSTIYGDIQFGALFEDKQGNVTILRDIGLVESNRQIIEGDFQVESDGTVYLVWENSFAWMSKKLTYCLELFIPDFTASDFLRSSNATELYRAVSFDTKVLKYESKKIEKIHRQLLGEIPPLADKLHDLQMQLSRKRVELDEELAETRITIDVFLEVRDKRNGLFIRCLNKDIMIHILKYLDNTKIQLVCKYWRELSKTAKLLPTLT